MPSYALGGYFYDVNVSGGSAHFKFYDTDDTNNTAAVTVAEKDFPKGVTDPTSRQVADAALLQVKKQLDDTRDERLRKEADDRHKAAADENARQRDAADELHANSQDVATQPAKVESDGTHVYNTDPQGGTAKEDAKKK
jgi:hypothetical protein